jgi:sarcosine oxidase
VVAWFQPRHPQQFQPQEFPVFNLLESEGRFYGLPIFGAPGLKVGCYHHLQQTVDPDSMDREPHPEDEELLRGLVKRCFPNADGPTLSLQTCLFTNTPDEHFILDGHPEFERVWVAAGFSGHGFKFSSVVGEIMADLVQQAGSRHDLGLFRMGRFQTELHRPSSSEN